MSKINLLSKEISELIAAGEVIERPSSVIKELLENSIDSGAEAITVEIKNGGISYMRITDNGCGISETDVPTAFLRHATSKITTKDDLDKILTLGFRGEALASIAAVSKVDLLTKQTGEQYGTHYVVEGSEEKLNEKSGCPNGTTVVIRDIFYNVPARLKFLKKDVTEGNNVASVINKLALSHPEISFKFIRDNKQELCTAGDGDAFSSIYSVFGKQFASTLIPVDYTSGQITVRGFTVKPTFSRNNRSLQSFFINGRYVKSTTCSVALEEAYKNIIMTGKFPACVIDVLIPPNTVDVNVHPSKTEVRFSDDKTIFNSIYFAVKNALLLGDTPNKLVISDKNELPSTVPETGDKPQNTINLIEPKAEQVEFELHSHQNKYNAFKNTEAPEIKTYTAKELKSVIESVKPLQPANDAQQSCIDNFKYINKSSFEKIIVANTEQEKIELPEIRIIGEVFLNYIIAEINEQLLLIDKHAAHERLIFEELKSKQGDLESQIFLIPAEVVLSYEEYDAVMNNMEIFEKLGFLIEISDASRIIVNGAPIYFTEADVQGILSETAQNLLQYKSNPQFDLIDELFHSMACKAAIKANDKSDLRELKALADKIYNNENIRYCPHGRPVMVTITKKDLEKQFKRII